MKRAAAAYKDIKIECEFLVSSEGITLSVFRDTGLYLLDNLSNVRYYVRDAHQKHLNSNLVGKLGILRA